MSVSASSSSHRQAEDKEINRKIYMAVEGLRPQTCNTDFINE